MMPASVAVPLPVLVPLVLALGALLCPAAWLRWGARIGALACAAAPLPGVRLILSHGPAEIALGGWETPLGIRLVLDGLSGLFLLFHSLVGAAVAWHAGSIRPPPTDTPPRSSRPVPIFWPLFFLLWGGLNALVLSQDLFNLYVCLEFISLAGVGLILLSGSVGALRAAVNYLLLALLGGLLYLLGVGLLYSRTGVLDLEHLAAYLAPGLMLNAGLTFMMLGLMIKSALFPLHTWLPPAHAGAPAPVSALLSGLVISAAYLVVLRLWTSGFHRLAPEVLPRLFSVLGSAGIVWGGVLALRQDRLKRVLAYSTVSQTGYLFLVFALSGAETRSQGGVWAGSIYLAISHGLAKAGAFLAAGMLMQRCGSDRLEDLRGAATAHPLPVALLGLAAATLMGLPPGLGFTGKWMLLDAAFQLEQWASGLMILVGGLLAAGYLMRVIERCFRTDPAATAPVPPSDRAGPMFPVLILVLAPFVLSWLLAGPDNLLRIGAPLDVPAWPGAESAP